MVITYRSSVNFIKITHQSTGSTVNRKRWNPCTCRR